MKRFMIIVVVAISLFLSFWGGKNAGNASGNGSGTANSDKVYHKQLCAVTASLIENHFNSLDKGVQNASNVLRRNRDFVLSYFHDNDLANPVVRSVATQYGELLAADGFEIISPEGGSLVSKYGVCPTVSDTVSVESVIVSDGILWFGAASKMEVGDKNLLLRGWIRLDSAKLKKISGEIKSELMITRGDAVLLTTLSGVERVHMAAEDCIIIDSEEVPVVTIALSDSLALLSILSPEGV